MATFKKAAAPALTEHEGRRNDTGHLTGACAEENRTQGSGHLRNTAPTLTEHDRRRDDAGHLTGASTEEEETQGSDHLRKRQHPP